MRTFAFVVLLALALLPKTAWVVRNEADVLMGKWARDPQVAAPVPSWAFEPDRLDDPIAKAFAPPIARRAPEFHDKWTADRALLQDPLGGAKALGSVLRRALSAGVPSLDRPAPPEKRALAESLLPLALAGERAEPDNAFYPAAAWMLDTILDRKADALAALERAARGSRFADASFEEPRLFLTGFEGQYGYRGSYVRLLEAFSVWLPHLSGVRNAAELACRKTPLGGPSRRAVLRLGETLIRTSPTLIGSLTGRTMVYLAIGLRREDEAAMRQKAPEAFRAFLDANPGFEDRNALDLALRVKDVDEFAQGADDVLSEFSTPLGAVLLLAFLGALAAAWPARREERKDFEGRLRRASWAWLGMLPAALYDARPVVVVPMFLGALASVALARRGTRRASVVVGAGVALAGLALVGHGWALPSLVWAAALGLPERGRPWAWGVAALAASGLSVWASLDAHLGPAWPLAFPAFATLPLALPLRKGAAWVPAVLAVLYLGGMAVELRADAQIGEVLRQIDTEAARFRAERGI